MTCNNYNSKSNLKNKYNDSDSINISTIKINELLGDDFELSFIDVEPNNLLTNIKTLNFKFVNKLELKNSEKSEYINEKIELLKNNNFIEVEDIKISGVGRFIRIYLKSIRDYENDKILLLKEFIEKINIIDEKINILKKIN